MKKKLINLSVFFTVIAFTSCLKDLNQVPFIEDSSETIYRDPSNYEAVLAKLYAGLGTTGQAGPAGKPDIVVPDEGFSEYTRQYWKLQELSTDEAVVGWGDNGIRDLHEMKWSTSNQFVTNFYNRLFFQISSCNDFLRETTSERLRERGIEQAVSSFIKTYRAEARFLRALSYFHALDMYGNVPFVTENDAVGAFQPKQVTRKDLATYIESELKAIEPDLLPAKSGIYRANQAACWALLARFYLNHNIYTGQSKYNEAIEYSAKVIKAGYTLQNNYSTLFMADNHISNEIIFSVAYDGLKTQTWGGTTFLVNASIGGKRMNPADYGTAEKWGGLRTTKSLVNRFTSDDIQGKGDKRAIFYTNGQKIEIDTITEFTNGYAVTKFVNKTSDGKAGSHPKHSDTDFPIFRLAEAYLIYAEATLRGGNGDIDLAFNYIDALRKRANALSIKKAELTLDFLLEERSRELYWEGHRRTDLIRYGKFTSASFLWPWKGGAKDGVGVEEYLTLYPIPADDMAANGNLKQNFGYK